jgi:hypothetical protein
MSRTPYLPAKIFNAHNEITPRVMVAPQRYIQGPGVLNQIDRYLSLLNVKRVGILASRRGQAAEGQRIAEKLKNDNIDAQRCPCCTHPKAPTTWWNFTLPIRHW